MKYYNILTFFSKFPTLFIKKKKSSGHDAGTTTETAVFKFVTMKQLQRCKVSLCLEPTVGKKLNGDFWNVNAADKKTLDFTESQ